MADWLVQTLRAHPEIAVFLAVGLGFWFGRFSWRGIGLGTVTSTLLAALALGQLGIEVSPHVTAVFFLLVLFSVGYAVGPQFVSGIAKDGVPQAAFSFIVCLICVATTVIAARIAGYDPGTAAGLFAGAQTISPSIGLATDAINRAGLPPDQARAYLNAIPVAYAVTYIYGTVGSGVVLAILGPRLLGIDLPAACRDYAARMNAGPPGGAAWHSFELRAYRIAADSPAVGRSVAEVQAMLGDGRLALERIRRDGAVREAAEDLRLAAGDVVAVAGLRAELVRVLGGIEEVQDRELLAVPVGGVPVFVTAAAADGRTLAELAEWPQARGVHATRIVRGATATEVPLLAGTRLRRGDIITLVGRTPAVAAMTAALGRPDEATPAADVAFIGLAIALGTVLGSIVVQLGSVPFTVGTAGGALFVGLFFGWLRSVRPTFGRIPGPTVWFMNQMGLNVFIAAIGLGAGPAFVAGLKVAGLSLLLWGAVATTVPLIAALYLGRYVFRFDPALLFGIVCGARTTTAAIDMVIGRAGSPVPGLGYTVAFAVANPTLTICGMVIVLLMQ